eukprot:CAMPEP_0183405130 /NCGR_PEP_ID=MMETSP0370-20130417/15583_1 /TAXON_ID=268820 /ORGANISM="Peridinium aciculiferum, Strain PAER-2" /LENGTH=429 /DNA_ID=CAMNT_0025587043 /DNA_START=1 /DNA_END=1290 /DNA_ORIENTATION=+
MSSDAMFEHNVPSTPPRSLTGEVRPRTIWAYWAQGYARMPDFFKLCVSTWQNFNPSWDVRIIQQSTVDEYLSAAELPNRFMQMTSHQAASDAVRLGLLSRYGGIWMDVSILCRTDLDSFCWNEVASRNKKACVFYHPHYGTEAFDNKDLTESWFLATLPGNPFFMRWRDLFRELLHNRLDVKGLLQHPFYQDIDLSGIHRLNQQFGADFDFREYLAIHSMCHRMIEKDPEAHVMWQDDFLRIDAATSAFRMQLQAEQLGSSCARVLLLGDGPGDAIVDGIPLIKFTTPHYGPLLMLSREQLLDKNHLLGRLLSPPAPSRSPGVARPATSSSMSGPRAISVRKLCHSRSTFALGLGATVGLLGARHCSTVCRRVVAGAGRSENWARLIDPAGVARARPTLINAHPSPLRLPVPPLSMGCLFRGNCGTALR